jgi:hypothetical protein
MLLTIVKKYIILFVALLLKFDTLAQTPIASLPELVGVRIFEVTNTVNVHEFPSNGLALNNRIGESLGPSNNDFLGVPAAEFYDVFYSDQDGSFNALGSYLTIECKFTNTSGGGGMNISHIELLFPGNFTISSNNLSSFYGAGSNYIAGTEINAVDCNPNTLTTMGNNSATSTTKFLRLTVSFESRITNTNLFACKGSGFSYTTKGTLFNEANPSGNVYSMDNCNDRLEIVNILYIDQPKVNYSIVACKGEGFSITIGGKTFDENNPIGTAISPSNMECDTLYNVNITFETTPEILIAENICSGTDYSITIGGIVFDENNPRGIVVINNNIGCDSIYTIDLNFTPSPYVKIEYNGCASDGYSYALDGQVYNEDNPKGTQLVTSTTGCDTIYYINLSFNPLPIKKIEAQKCKHEDYEITIGGITFDQNNPIGFATVKSTIGCDTLYEVNLSFIDNFIEYRNYSGCVDDGYSLEVGMVLFDESNPIGQLVKAGINGNCDTTVIVNLIFDNYVTKSLSRIGCQGDQFSIEAGGQVFNESNPSGQVRLTAAIGCDTLYDIQLTFMDLPTKMIEKSICQQSGFEITIDGIVFNEFNPKGSLMVESDISCDTFYSIYLDYVDCEKCKVVAPNIISLSSTVGNHLFYITPIDNCETNIYSLKIYDRWGNLVHVSSDAIWDGKMYGEFVEKGVYAYYLEYSVFNESRSLTGDITVIK